MINRNSTLEAEVRRRRQAEEEQKRQFKQLQAVYRMTEAVNHATAVSEIYEAALDALHDVLDADRAAVLLYNSHNHLCFVAARGLSERYQRAVEGHSPWKPGSKPAPIFVDDVTEAPALAQWRETICNEGIYALAFVPLLAHEELLGKLMLYYNTPHAFNHEEERLAQEIAHQVALAHRQAVTQSELQWSREELEQRVSERTQELSETVAALQKEVQKRRRAEQRIRRQARRTKALLRTAARLNAQLDLGTVLTAICEETAAALRVPYVVVSLYDEQQQLFYPMRGYGLPEEFFQQAEPLTRAQYDQFVQQFGTLIVTPDVQTLTDLPNQAWYRQLDIHTTASVSMARNGTLVGRLNIACSGAPRHFSRQELALLQGLADQAALAIANAREVNERRRAEEALAQEKERLENLYAFSHNLSMTLNPREVGNRALDGVMDLVGGCRGEMFLLNGVGDRLRLIAVSGYDRRARPLLDARAEIRLGQGLPGHVAQTRRSLALAPGDGGDQPWQPVAGLDDAITSALAAPLLTGAANELVGVLMLLSDQPDFFTQKHLALMEAAAKPIAYALQNARLYEAEHRARQVADRLRAANLALSERLDLPPLLETLLDQLQSLVPYDSAAVLLLEGEKQLAARAARPQAGLPPGSATAPAGQLFNVEQFPHLHTVWATQRGLIIRDTAVYPGWPADNNTAGVIRSWLGAPLLIGGKFIGAFALGSDKVDFFTEIHLHLVEAMARQAAIAIHNAQLYDQLDSGREQLRGLNHQVVTAQEDERHRLSYELHDEAGQALSGLKFNLSLIRDDLADDQRDLRRRIDAAVKLTDDTIEHIRSLAQTLRPPTLDIIGLNSTLQNLCRNFARTTTLAIEYQGAELPPLSGRFSIAFYRFLQEALSNVAKHADARRVWVTLRYDGRQVSLTVTDDGRGFDPGAAKQGNGRESSLGLFAMRERFALMGGRLQIETEPGQGVRLIAQAPWQESV